MLEAVDETTVFLHHFREEGVDSPAINFAQFLCAALGTPSQPLFRFLMVKYEPTLKRDPTLQLYLSRISKTFFGEELVAETSTSSLLKEMFS